MSYIEATSIFLVGVLLGMPIGALLIDLATKIVKRKVTTKEDANV